MTNWLPTFPLLNRPPPPPDLRDLLADLDGWSIAELMRNERFAQAPDESLPPKSSTSARADQASARQLDWLTNAQWQSAPETAPWPEPPPTPRSAVNEDPFERDALRMRRSFISDARRRPPMGPPFLDAPPLGYPSHLAPISQAPDWQEVVNKSNKLVTADGATTPDRLGANGCRRQRSGRGGRRTPCGSNANRPMASTQSASV